MAALAAARKDDMPCNCGRRPPQYRYIYTDQNGRQFTYNTEIEAQAARSGNGGSGSIRSRLAELSP